MFIPYEIFITDCSVVEGLSTLGHVFPHRFLEFRLRTTRKNLINDTFNASLKSYNDTSLKCHGLDYHYISLHTMTLISSVIFVYQNYDIHLKRHSLLIIFQSNNLTMTLI